MDTMLAGQDKLILFGNPETAAAALQQFEIPLDRRDGKVSLGAQVSIDSFTEKRRKRSAGVGIEKKLNAGGAGVGKLNPMAAAASASGNGNREYQPFGGTGAEKKPVRLPGSDYQPLGGMDKKPSARFNSSMPGADYQPMGARQKSGLKTDSKPPNSSASAQQATQHYVPRGAARIHPMSQTPILENESQKTQNEVTP
jgi:hypothetical protein